MNALRVASVECERCEDFLFLNIDGKLVPCPDCTPVSEEDECESCGGQGRVERADRDGYYLVRCTECGDR